MFGDWATHVYLTAIEHVRAAVRRDDEEGQGMVEYGLLVALISIAAVAIITLIGTGLKANFQDVVNAL